MARLSFPRRRESKSGKACLDARFRGHDSVMLKNRETKRLLNR
jgi:hypothetical protein